MPHPAVNIVVMHWVAECDWFKKWIVQLHIHSQTLIVFQRVVLLCERVVSALHILFVRVVLLCLLDLIHNHPFSRMVACVQKEALSDLLSVSYAHQHVGVCKIAQAFESIVCG